MFARVADLKVRILPVLLGRCNAGFQDYKATHHFVTTMYLHHQDGKCAKSCPLDWYNHVQFVGMTCYKTIGTYTMDKLLMMIWEKHVRQAGSTYA